MIAGVVGQLAFTALLRAALSSALTFCPRVYPNGNWSSMPLSDVCFYYCRAPRGVVVRGCGKEWV